MNPLKGLIIYFAIFVASSFLLFQLFSPWAKTYWKRDLTIALIQSFVCCAILFFVGHRTNPVQYSDIIHALGTNTKELNNEPGIIRTGISGDRNKRVISIGIGMDQTEITEGQLKQRIVSYLNDSAAMTNEQDWEKLLLPYTLKIEEIGDSNNGKILAEKPPGATVITWNAPGSRSPD